MGPLLRRLSGLLWAGLLMLPLAAPAAPATAKATAGKPAERVYTLGVTPQFERRQLFAIWKPILIELEKRTGLRFDLAIMPDIPSFERQYNAGAFDFAYMNPYLMVANPAGYIPLVRDETPVTGILVVARDSPFRTPADLEGKEIAFPAPNAIGASLLIRAELVRKYKVNFTPRYVNSHTAVYLSVTQGLASAGGGVQKTLNEQKPEVQERLRVLYRTAAFAAHPIAAHPRVDGAVREQVRSALLDFAATPAGKALLQEIPLARMVPTAMKDYQPLKDLGLEDFFVPER
ncbi:phosphate/phosphite/phosphonate ABC transporter substrate-binding protein [Azospira sp.]|uniref:phosphate/phosphite/phosphonate ABC transporter substrate-binding protein n=1 Tax=Azospira sp. TaxID=1872671 RepID=UPI0025669B70|nr:phosphate/phosphite/phosphonate ABC transporter substrate-binding protein [Azospira sp.]MDK9689236.1 phosphate/phosphite/phosphonate ABC transporter substrate-binding protein [Azospira sp.]